MPLYTNSGNNMGFNLELYFKNFFEINNIKINEWLQNEKRKSPALIYNSMDLRNSGFKMAPVDLNFFPAGFNNLHPSSLALATQELKKFFISHGNPNKVLIIAENHDRNLKYLENILFLKNICLNLGVQTSVANLINETTKSLEINGQSLEINPLRLKNGLIISAADFIPDLIINNNDLTSGMPELFTTNQKQIIAPNPMCGWFNRRKTNYFASYEEICADFAKEFVVDPWFFSAYFARVNNVDFKARSGMENLAKVAQEIIDKTAAKYLEYSINRLVKPYCFIKANNGTYGMGVISVDHADEVLNLNKSNRTKMHVGKQGAEINEVLVQEGIPTIEKFGPATAEKTIYMVNGEIIGGFWRANQGKNSRISLNAASSFFEQIPFDQLSSPLVSFVATLAYLAALREIDSYKF